MFYPRFFYIFAEKSNSMELKISFTTDECMNILYSKGYIIEEVDGWYDENSYMTSCDENKMNSIKVLVAYKPEEKESLKKEAHPLLSSLKEYSLESATSRELKKSLLNLILQ